MPLLDEIQSAFIQAIAVFLICLSVYGVRRLIYQKRQPTTFRIFMGFVSARGQFDRRFFVILFGAGLFGLVLTLAQYMLGDLFREVLLSKSSPFARILMAGHGAAAIFAGLIYCFIQASLSEEMFFRGLIARRLYPVLGLLRGNLVQAFLFWLMHFVIFRLITGEWISGVQLMAFATSFLMGLALGYVNFRKQGQSIWPSIVLHGTANFCAFLTLAVIF